MSKSRYGTIIYPKNKRFYDFKINVEIMTRNRGSHGVIFRMIDPFNYYAFEININFGYKRIVKVVNGNLQVLNTVFDGGIAQNTWYKVEIKGLKTTFRIKIGESSKFSSFGATPVVFDFEDIDHTIGQ
jgi:hypothetical protein